MTMQRPTKILLAILSASLILACSAGNDEVKTTNGNAAFTTQKLLQKAQNKAHAAMAEKRKGEAKGLAMEGIEFAERCLMHSPESAGCHYWRAVNTGLYYKIRVVGYQHGIKSMIEDCKAAILINPQYEHASAYRMLGQIYTKLPQTGGRVGSITRDLPLAEEYLNKAIQISRDYPENYLSLAENLFEQNKISEAISALATARELTPQWKNDVSYKEWTSQMDGLQKKISKKQRKIEKKIGG